MSSYRCGCYDLYLAYSLGGSSSGNYGANPIVSEDTSVGRLPHHPRFNVTGTKRVNLKTSSNIRLRAFSIARAVLTKVDRFYHAVSKV